MVRGLLNECELVIGCHLTDLIGNNQELGMCFNGLTRNEVASTCTRALLRLAMFGALCRLAVAEERKRRD